MIPVTQSKVGVSGTCFRSCLASILELQEHEVPDINDFTEAGWQGAVDDFLGEYGLRYRRVPLYAKPTGYSTIEGVSPRGGLHACVALDGELVHDPHPQDGTGRGLVEPRYYGLLEKKGGRAADGELKTKFIDPDYRKDPRTSDYCIRCQKDFKAGQARRWLHLLDDGISVIHPSEEPVKGGLWGRVGSECARVLGLSWTHANRS